MREWHKVLIRPDVTIMRAIEIIDATAMGIVLVANPEGQLMGTVTDGDVRRAILRGQPLEQPVSNIMNRKPMTVRIHDSRDKVLEIMREKDIKQIPVIDDDGRIIGLDLVNDILRTDTRKNIVVLMAGGMGNRLQPLTSDCPKPMLKIGDKPVLETILDLLIAAGFKQFYLAVNYKAEMIEDYFGDGSDRGVYIRYLREKQRLGTAGALSLLPEKPAEPLLVMNGDLLTKINFQYLLDFHAEHKSKATMCVREYKIQIPYGVAKLQKHRLMNLIEKPVHQFFVSAGVYVLQPEALELIPADTYFDMPSLFNCLLKRKEETVAFPVREYWIDIGQMGDYHRANGEYHEVFR